MNVTLGSRVVGFGAGCWPAGYGILYFLLNTDLQKSTLVFMPLMDRFQKFLAMIWVQEAQEEIRRGTRRGGGVGRRPQPGRKLGRRRREESEGEWDDPAADGVWPYD